MAFRLIWLQMSEFSAVAFFVARHLRNILMQGIFDSQRRQVVFFGGHSGAF